MKGNQRKTEDLIHRQKIDFEYKIQQLNTTFSSFHSLLLYHTNLTEEIDYKNNINNNNNNYPIGNRKNNNNKTNFKTNFTYTPINNNDNKINIPWDKDNNNINNNKFNFNRNNNNNNNKFQHNAITKNNNNNNNNNIKTNFTYTPINNNNNNKINNQNNNNKEEGEVKFDITLELTETTNKCAINDRVWIEQKSICRLFPVTRDGISINPPSDISYNDNPFFRPLFVQLFDNEYLSYSKKNKNDNNNNNDDNNNDIKEDYLKFISKNKVNRGAKWYLIFIKLISKLPNTTHITFSNRNNINNTNINNTNNNNNNNNINNNNNNNNINNNNNNNNKEVTMGAVSFNRIRNFGSKKEILTKTTRNFVHSKEEPLSIYIHNRDIDHHYHHRRFQYENIDQIKKVESKVECYVECIPNSELLLSKRIPMKKSHFT